MKTGMLLAAIGNALVAVGPESPASLGADSSLLLMLVGLGGLALLTLRSERWAGSERAPSAC